MRKLIFLALAVALAFPLLGHTQPAVDQVQRTTLMSAFDLDGEAADNDQVIAATALVDNGTSVANANWTILAQPDTCRLLDLTIVDTDLTVGNITVAGTGCLGEAKSCTFAFTAGDNTGVNTLTCSDKQGAYFSNVATVTTDLMTGESNETFALGYTSNSVNGWPMYGRRMQMGLFAGVDPFGWYDVARPVTTAGVSYTIVVGVNAADDPFAGLAVGDLLIFQIGGQSYERKITTYTSADQVTINQEINIPAAGIPFRWKKMFFSTNPQNIMYIPVSGYRTALLDWSVDAVADTGGIVTLFQCTQERVEFPTARWVQLSTTTVATGGTQGNTSESVNLELLPYTYCRFGIRHGTGDDADGGANEDINATVTLIR